MPVLNCPHCQAVNALPDPWYAPGYTCHHCRQPVTISHPVAPAPQPFADLTEDDDRPVRRSRRTPPHIGTAHPALIVFGYLCALLSLGFFPPGLGLAGLIFGTVCLAQRTTVNGILIVILSAVCASIGMIWGIEAAIFGRPLFLLR